ncbi:hypothetical protein FRC03_009919 [Tulasnella sp. 419]|nr:hypothetical protein FRC03_009919 [Tulasnella sp. 419]
MATGWLRLLCYIVFLFVVNDGAKLVGSFGTATSFFSFSVLALTVNYTIDDAHATVSYSAGWTPRSPIQPCNGCFGALADPNRAFNQTWHETSEQAYFEFYFFGTSIIIYGTVPDGQGMVSSYAFEIDGVSAGSFQHSGTSGGAYLYQTAIFEAKGLEPNVVHRFVGQNGFTASSMAFDYAVVENEIPDSVVAAAMSTAQTTGAPINPTGASASLGTQSAANQINNGKAASGFPVAAVAVPLVLAFVGAIAGAVFWFIQKRRQQRRDRIRRMRLDLDGSDTMSEHSPPSPWIPPHLKHNPTLKRYTQALLYQPHQPYPYRQPSRSFSSSSIISGSNRRISKLVGNTTVTAPHFKASISQPLPCPPPNAAALGIAPPNPLYHLPNQHLRSQSDVVPASHIAHLQATGASRSRTTSSLSLSHTVSEKRSSQPREVVIEDDGPANDDQSERKSQRISRAVRHWDENQIKLPPIPRFSAIPPTYSVYHTRKSTIKGRTNEKLGKVSEGLIPPQ